MTKCREHVGHLICDAVGSPALRGALIWGAGERRVGGEVCVVRRGPATAAPPPLVARRFCALPILRLVRARWQQAPAAFSRVVFDRRQEPVGPF